MKRLFTFVLAVLLCCAGAICASAETLDRSYTAGGGDTLAVAAFIVVCVAALVFLVSGYHFSKKKHINDMKKMKEEKNLQDM